MHEIMPISAQDTDEQAGQKVKEMIQKMSEGRYGKKVLLRLETAE